jgi:TRAP-type C4-dicarboxylate transport system permease large subunit
MGLWAGIMICIMVMIRSVIQHVAICDLIVKNIIKIPLNVIYGSVFPFLIGLIVSAILLFIFPQTSLVPSQLSYEIRLMKLE